MSFLRRIVSFALIQMVIEVVATVVLVALLSFLLNILPATFLQSTIGATLTNVLYACVIVGVLFLTSRWLEHRPLSEIGLPRHQWRRPLLLGFLLGGILMGSVIGVMALAGFYRVTAIEPIHAIQLFLLFAASGMLVFLFFRNKGNRRIGLFHYLLFVCLVFGLIPVAAPLLLYLAAAVQEELIFRGMIFRLLERALGSWIAVILSALTFGAIHLANPGATLVSALAIMLTGGVLIAAIYLLTRSLWWMIGVHLGWNFFEGPIFGAAISGKSAEGLIHASLTGSQVWTGGAFGPEAGLVAILMVGSAGFLLCVLAARRHCIMRPSWLQRPPQGAQPEATEVPTSL